MKTDDLIQTLAAGVRPVRRLPKASERCARWLGLALTLVVVGAAVAGLRPDLVDKSRDVFFLVENASLLLVFVLAARSAFELSVPDDERPAAAYSLPLLAFGLWLGLVLVRNRNGVEAMGHDVAAKTGIACVMRIWSLGILPALTCWTMLRRAAPLSQGWAGLFLGLSAFSLAAGGTQMLCAVDEPAHVLWWHCVPVLLLGLAGGCLGKVAFMPQARPAS